jgi:hypothetical protein
MSAPVIELTAAELDITLDPGDRVLSITWPDTGFDMSGSWGLTVRATPRSADAVLDVALSVDDTTTSYAFDAEELLDLIPHTGDGADRDFVADMFAGSYVVSQDGTPRLKGAFTVVLTAQRSTGS